MKVLIATCAVLLLIPGCNKDDKPEVVWIDESDVPKQAGKTEQQLKEEYEARQEALENQPEPELDPNDPREKWQLVWNRGEAKLNMIYDERAEMIGMLKRVKWDDKLEDDKKIVDAIIPKLTEFGVGRDVEYMEKAPAELCKLIEEVRPQADKLIDEGTVELKRIAEETEQLDALAADGGTVLQKKWDKLDEEHKRWSAPVKAGKQILLVFRSFFDEALVIAEWGPRRAQITLRDCLTKIAETPLSLDLAQTALETVLARSKYYRRER